jgi:hypothetical protein
VVVVVWFGDVEQLLRGENGWWAGGEDEIESLNLVEGGLDSIGFVMSSSTYNTA